MERPSRQATGLALVGLSAIAVAVHDGLSLVAPVRRVVTRADPPWLVLVVLFVAGGLLAVRRSRRRTRAGRGDRDDDCGHTRSVTNATPATTLVPVALAVAGLVTILVGVHTDSLHVKPMYDYTVTTGWDGPLNYQEREMLELAAIGVLGTLAALRWRRVAYGAIAAGALVLVYPVRFLTRRIGSVTEGMVVFGGETIELSYGAEPFLLLLGGTLLVLAGVAGVGGAVPGSGRIGAVFDTVGSA